MNPISLAALAAGACLGALVATAQESPIAPPGPKAEVRAAMTKAQAGDVAELVRLATAGDRDAQAAAGDVYRLGRGVAADPKAARAWYQKAADQKQGRAARLLGEMYAKGEGGKKDTKKAMALWRDAEKAGDPMSAILVADQLFSQLTGGKPVGPGKFAFKGGIPVGDVESAEAWYQEAQKSDPRPEVKQRAAQALSVLGSFKAAAQGKGQVVRK